MAHDSQANGLQSDEQLAHHNHNDNGGQSDNPSVLSVASQPSTDQIAAAESSSGDNTDPNDKPLNDRPDMSSADPGILCFQHCNPKSKVFCLELPDYCPQCDSPMSCVELKIPPFCVPYPFTCAKRTQCSVIIRPTDGDFLHHYQNAADLHIGLTDSKGDVYEFDRYGLQTGTRNSSWNQCLSVPIVTEIDNMWKDYWDYTLQIAAQLDRWQPNQYSEDNNNCYSFVITFLRMLRVKDLKPSLNSKTQFCKDFIVPRTKNAAKYIALYRRVVKEGVCVLSTQ